MRDIRITAEEWSRGVRHCGNCDGHGFYGVWNGTDYDRTECIDCNQTGRTASRAAMGGVESLVEAEKARAIRCGQLLMELGAANKRIAQVEHRPETKAEALRSLGLRRGKAADGTEVWE